MFWGVRSWQHYLESSLVSVVTVNGTLESFMYWHKDAWLRFNMHDTTRLALFRLYATHVWKLSGSSYMEKMLVP